MPRGFQQVVPAHPYSLGGVRRSVRELIDGKGSMADAPTRGSVELAVSEAVSNAIVHAYPEREGVIGVEATLGDRTLVVSVRDFGRGMRPRHERQGLGLGLSLISALSDAVLIRQRAPGTQIEMTFGLDEARRAEIRSR